MSPTVWGKTFRGCAANLKPNLSVWAPQNLTRRCSISQEDPGARSSQVIQGSPGTQASLFPGFLVSWSQEEPGEAMGVQGSPETQEAAEPTGAPS